MGRPDAKCHANVVGAVARVRAVERRACASSARRVLCGCDRRQAAPALTPGARRRGDGHAAWSTATRSTSRSAARDERVRLIGIDTPETKKPNTPVECFGPEASAFTASLLPSGTDGAARTRRRGRDDYGRLLGLRVPASVDDGTFVNLEIVAPGLRPAADDRTRTSPTPASSSSAARARGGAPTLGLWATCSRDASGSVAAVPMTHPRRTSRVPARRPPGHHLLRRPRQLPRRQRGRVRRAARRRGHLRIAHGAGTVGPPRRTATACPPTTSACTSRSTRARELPLGPDHPRPVAAVGRGRLPPHPRRPVGARRPRRGAARVPRPDRAGASPGASTSPTSPRT